jgi:mediator of RNA polymerase II transcription subunit 21
MTDRLTQIQDCLDQLLTQMYASIRYIDTHHPYASIPNQADQNPFAPAPQPQLSSDPSAPQAQGAPHEKEVNPNEITGETAPDSKELFEARLQELAQDLIVKERQIEVLVESLPGLGNSREDQERRIRELEGELKAVEGESVKAREERERLVELVEGKILGVRRV